jgi:hypothetical protein
MNGVAVIFPCFPPMPDIPLAPAEAATPPVLSPQAPLTGLNPFVAGMIY